MTASPCRTHRRRIGRRRLTGNPAPGGGFETGVAFGPDGSAAVPGYRTDLGNGYRPQSNGYTFGWVDPSTGAATSNSGNSFARSAQSDPRLTRGITTVGKSWEMLVPNGTYYVTLVAGDANVTSGTYGYGVENVAGFLSGTASSTNRWITASGQVVVTDGKLTVYNTSGVTNHALAYVNITDYAAHNRSTVVAPIAVVATASAGNTVDVRWTDHSDNDTGFKVERLDGNGTPTLLGTTYPNAGVFTDTTASPSTTYTYRVTALNGTFASASVVSNAITTPVGSPGQIPYNVTRTAWTSDTTIQAEDFDSGGETVSYVDAIGGNAGGYYRSGDADVGYNVSDDHYFLGWNRGGEWAEYTLNVPTAGTYQFQASVASEGLGGTFAVGLNGTTKASGLQVPDTGSFNTYQTITTGTFTLAAGSNQVLRLTSTADDPTGYWVGDVDWIKLVRVGDATGSIGGTVYDDRNGNGAHDDGSVPGVPPTVVYLVDQSLLTSDEYFDGTENGNVNRDPLTSQVLDAEIAGLLSMDQQLIADGFGNTATVSVIGYAGGGNSIDLDPSTPGTQLFTHPLTDADGDGVPDVEEAVRAMTTMDYANFDVGLLRTIQVVDAANIAPGTGTVVILSAGQNTDGDGLADAAATLHDPARGLTVKAFGFGGHAYMTNLQIVDPNATRVTSTDQVTVAFPSIAPSTTPEEGLAGWQVYADANGNGAFDAGEPTATTGADGSYTLVALAAGTYAIRVAPQSGWSQTTPSVGSYSVTLAAGQDASGEDFGEHQPGTTTIVSGGTNANHHPLPIPYAPQAAPEAFAGTPWSWNAGAAFADADGDALHFAFDYKHYQQPYPQTNGLRLDPDTGLFSWTPQPSDAINSIRFIDYVVTDGHGPGSAYYGMFDLMVLPARTGPLASIAASGAPIHEDPAAGPNAATFTVTLTNVAGVTTPITVNLTAPDHYDGDAGSDDYTVSGLDGSTLPSSVTFTPPAGGFGSGPVTRTFTVTAVNDGVTEGDEILAIYATAGTGYTVGSPTYADVTIVDDGSPTPNHPPHAVTTAPQPPTTATVGQTYTWDFSQDFADEDAGDTLHYTSLVAPPGDAVLDPTTGVFTWTPTADDVGTMQLSFVIDDGHDGGTISRLFSIDVSISGSTDEPLTVVDAFYDNSTPVAGVTISWIPLDNATTYEVWRSDDPSMEGAAQIAAGLTDVSYHDSTVQYDREDDYYYAIVANVGNTTQFQAQSESAETDSGKIYGPPSPPTPANGVGAPTKLYAERVDENTIELTWHDRSSISRFSFKTQDFIVQKRTGTSWVNLATVEDRQTHYVVTGLDANTEYEFRVIEETFSSASGPNIGNTYSSGVVVTTPEVGEFKGLVIVVLGHLQHLNQLPPEVYQSADNEPFFSRNHRKNTVPGVTEIALQLRRLGYRVLRLSEDDDDVPDVNYQGKGWPVDWALDRMRTITGIRQAAIVGYSHGASVAVKLANQIEAQRDPLRDQWNISYLATIDGIDRGPRDTVGFALNQSTNFDLQHENFYSLEPLPKAWGLINVDFHGGTIAAADFESAIAEDHANIDNNDDVEDTILGDLQIYTAASD